MNILDKVLQSKALERTKRVLGKATGLHIKVKRFSPSASEELRTAKLLEHFNIDFVIDIGANTGQFAESLYDFGYTGKVISFEPVSTVHKELLSRSKKYPNWEVYERCAIGSEDGSIDVNVTDDTVFSSVLEIKNSYTAHNPKSKIVKREKTPIHRLDTIVNEIIPGDAKNILLKIDTQGYEKEVLEGATNFIKIVKGIKIEIPLYPIYSHNKFTFYDIVNIMQSKNFGPFSFNIEGVDWTTGRVNTIDGLFFKAD